MTQHRARGINCPGALSIGASPLRRLRFQPFRLLLQLISTFVQSDQKLERFFFCQNYTRIIIPTPILQVTLLLGHSESFPGEIEVGGARTFELPPSNPAASKAPPFE
jgi:hypothetical protein